MRFSRRTTGSARAATGVIAAAATALLVAVGVLAMPDTVNAAVGSGTYTITNGASGLCLDLPSSSTSSGVQVDVQTCAGSADQTWTLTASGSAYTIASPVSGLCLGIAGA